MNCYRCGCDADELCGCMFPIYRFTVWCEARDQTETVGSVLIHASSYQDAARKWAAQSDASSALPMIATSNITYAVTVMAEGGNQSVRLFLKGEMRPSYHAELIP